MTSTFEDTIGIVGAGAMGFPIMGYMLKAGLSVVCCDLDDGRLADAEALGARPTKSVSDLGDCSVLLVFVPTDDDVRAVATEYAEVAKPGAIFVIHSSAQTATCQSIGAQLGAKDIRVVDAALTGGVRGAENGTINLLVGGAAEDVASLQPVFAPWTGYVHHLGELGCGQVGKTVNNLIHWAEIVVIAEALSLGAELGVPAERMREALKTGTTDSRTLRDLEDMRFTWFEKDIDNAVEMAATVGRELALTPLVQQLMRSINVKNVAELLAGEGLVEIPVPNQK